MADTTNTPRDYDAPSAPPNPKPRYDEYEAARRRWGDRYGWKDMTTRSGPIVGTGCTTVPIGGGCGSTYIHVMLIAGDPAEVPIRATRRLVHHASKPALAKTAPGIASIWISTTVLSSDVVAFDVEVLDEPVDVSSLSVGASDDVFTAPLDLTGYTDGVSLFLENDCYQPLVELGFDAERTGRWRRPTAVATGLEPGSYEVLAVAEGRDYSFEHVTLRIYPKQRPAYTVIQTGSRMAQQIVDPGQFLPPTDVHRFTTRRWIFLSGYRSSLSVVDRLTPREGEAFADGADSPYTVHLRHQVLIGADDSYTTNGVGGYAPGRSGVIGAKVEGYEVQLGVSIVERAEAPQSIDADIEVGDDAFIVSTQLQDSTLEIFDDEGVERVSERLDDATNVGLRVVLKNREGVNRVTDRQMKPDRLSPEWVLIEWWPLPIGASMPTQIRETSPYSTIRSSLDNEPLILSRRRLGLEKWAG